MCNLNFLTLSLLLLIQLLQKPLFPLHHSPTLFTMKLPKKPSFFGSTPKKPKTQTQPQSRHKIQPQPPKRKTTRQELERVLRKLVPDPPTDEEIMTMLAEADRDGNGSINLDEIAGLGSGFLGWETELRETFDVFDTDGDGKISAEELMGLFVVLGDDDCRIEECERMIRAVDSDGDGFVCFRDFVRMMELQR